MSTRPEGFLDLDKILLKTINSHAPCQKRITWECCNIVQKQVISQLSNLSLASAARLIQNVIYGIISPNRGLTSHEVWLLDEVCLYCKITWEC